MNGAFTTGEFAALCGVTKHTLFHYDALGILSPARVGQNGYRYYAPQQLEVFHVIETLRELDMPLSEIRAYLDRRSPGELVELLEREGALLDRKLRRLRQMRDLARQKAALTRSALARTPGVVAEEVQPEALLVCTPSHPMTSDADSARSLAEHVRYCQAHGVRSPHPVGCMLPLEGARSWDLSAYTHFYTQVSRRPGRDTALYVRQAGRYLTLFHTGATARWRRATAGCWTTPPPGASPCAAPSLRTLCWTSCPCAGMRITHCCSRWAFPAQSGPPPPEPDTALPPPAGPAAATRCSR